MFNRLPDIPKYYQRQIEAELERTLAVLKITEHTTQEYAKMLGAAERLYGMLDEPKKSAPPVSREALLTVGANLLGILMIIKHESVNVISSKALGFVARIR